MDFEVSVGKIVAPVWNKDDVKAAVSAKLAEYENAVYTPETIQTAKSDRADLNKIAKAIEDERKRVKALYNAPYLAFEKEVKEVTGMIEKTVSAIDTQVKAFETRAKEAKAADVRSMYTTFAWYGVPYEKIASDKWLLASTSMATVAREMSKISEDIAADMGVLQTVEEYQFEAIEKYRATRSLADAMRTVNELKAQAERKAKFEAAKITAPEVAPATVAPDTASQKPDGSILYNNDDLPDFDAIGDGRFPFIIKAKITDTEKAQICEFLAKLHVEYEIIGG